MWMFTNIQRSELLSLQLFSGELSNRVVIDQYINLYKFYENKGGSCNGYGSTTGHKVIELSNCVHNYHVN
jgi:hypothetical protein